MQKAEANADSRVETLRLKNISFLNNKEIEANSAVSRQNSDNSIPILHSNMLPKQSRCMRLTGIRHSKSENIGLVAQMAKKVMPRPLLVSSTLRQCAALYPLLAVDLV